MSEKKLSSEYKIAIVGSVAGVIATGIYDHIKEQPILSTLWSWIKWVWNNIFEYQFTVWQIILGLVILICILWIIAKIKNPDNYNSALWLLYQKETIDWIDWTWKWEKGL